MICEPSGWGGPLRSPGAPPALLYSIEAPVKAAALPVGEFNRSHLATGQPRRALVNGVRMEARWSVAPHIYELLAKQPKKLCPVTLQNHGNAAWFRNIKIRKLD
jgi:hypothetical protein